MAEGWPRRQVASVWRDDVRTAQVVTGTAEIDTWGRFHRQVRHYVEMGTTDGATRGSTLGRDVQERQVCERLSDWTHERRQRAMIDLPEGVDPRLRLTRKDGWGTAYFVGNPHTFRGRISVWDESTGREVSISKDEIADMTEFAAVWLDGFLAGSEPPPPVDITEDEEHLWLAARMFYRENGREA